jgi:N-carbamoyl-L-amino-acid hydrolase
MIKEAGLKLPFHLEVIDFSDEEGTLVGLLGSQALAGLLRPEDLQNPRGGRDEFLEGLSNAGLSEDGLFKAARDAASLAGYLELHIEQGPRLAQSGVQIGVVTGIVGICSYRLEFLGRADHAGTTPMTGRQDAAQGAAELVIAVRQLILENYPDCMANIGILQLFPGAFNIVPARAMLGLELRATDQETISRLEDAALEAAQLEADRHSLGLEVEFLSRHAPAPMHQVTQQAIIDAANLLNLRRMRMTSGAGHDAQVLSTLCPSGMIFVPSKAGASHSRREFTEWQDCLNGANVMLQASLNLANMKMKVRE